MRSTIILLLGILLTSSTLFAQIYPRQTERERLDLRGPVELVTDVSRSYSQATERWEPLTLTSIMHFNRQGNLLKRGTYISREESDKDLYVYSADSNAALPVFDATAMLFRSEKSEPLEEYLYAYEEDGRLAGVIERHYNTGRTIRRAYAYDDGRLTTIVSRDSASNGITEVERFHYHRDGKPTGSSVQQFDLRRDTIRNLSDTMFIPAERVARVYTSYVYNDPSTPVIFWRWSFGNDTVVDMQEIKRYQADGMLTSSTAQMFRNGKLTSSQAYVFNTYGDALSSAASFGNDTTYERGFDYIYGEPDDGTNWTVRRQYSVNGDDTSKKILIARTDRRITYYK